jgi:hypothetical protein
MKLYLWHHVYESSEYKKHVYITLQTLTFIYSKIKKIFILLAFLVYTSNLASIARVLQYTSQPRLNKNSSKHS